MTTSFELANLLIEESIDPKEYKILIPCPSDPSSDTFEKVLYNEVCERFGGTFGEVHACVGSVPLRGENGYLIKDITKAKEVTITEICIIGAADAIYWSSVRGEIKYFLVWAIDHD